MTGAWHQEFCVFPSFHRYLSRLIGLSMLFDSWAQVFFAYRPRWKPVSTIASWNETTMPSAISSIMADQWIGWISVDVHRVFGELVRCFLSFFWYPSCWSVASGKRLHNELENHHFQWVNHLFLWPFSTSFTVILLFGWVTCLFRYHIIPFQRYLPR